MVTLQILILSFKVRVLIPLPIPRSSNGRAVPLQGTDGGSIPSRGTIMRGELVWSFQRMPEEHKNSVRFWDRPLMYGDLAEMD